MIKTRYSLLIPAAVFCLALPLHRSSGFQSGSTIGGTAGAPMRMGFGARGIGMGNALTAVSFGDVSAYYNPALVPYQSSPVGSASFGFLSFDRRLNFLSYTQSLKPSAGVSLSIINAGVSHIDGRDRDGVHTEDYSTSENAFMFSFGLKFDEQISLGITAKLLYYSLLKGVSSTTVGFDLGARYVLSDEWAVAAVLQDVNSKYKWETTKQYGRKSTTDTFPLRRRVGVGFTPQGWGAVFSTEVELIGSSAFWRIGTEVSLYEGFQVRGGIDQVSFNGEVTAKPAIGMSAQTAIAEWKPSLQYTYVLEPYSTSGIHLLSISFTFD